MSKSDNKSPKQSSVPATSSYKGRGSVDRSHNRTVDQSRKASEPKWIMMPKTCVLVPRNDQASNCRLHMKKGVWTSRPKHAPDAPQPELTLERFILPAEGSPAPTNAPKYMGE